MSGSYPPPAIPDFLRLAPEQRRAGWAGFVPPAVTKTPDPENIRLRELEAARIEAQKKAKAAALEKMKDEHADRGEIYRKGIGWVRDPEALRKLREREFAEHAATQDSPSTRELQAEPVESLIGLEIPAALPPGLSAVDAATPSTRDELQSTVVPAKQSPRPLTRTKQASKRRAVVMPALMPPLPPSMKR